MTVVQKAEKRALVVGLGVAGMSAAIGLRDAGWTPVIVERAAERRTGGYFVGLFPEGRAAAGRLGLMENLHTRDPIDGKDWNIDSRGRNQAGMGFLDQPGAPTAVMRGDIEAALWEKLQEDPAAAPVEIRFGVSPKEIVDGPDGARVSLVETTTGAQREEAFDLVVGADGLRSTVRRLAFGPDADFMKSWGVIICAYELREQVPSYGAQDSLILARSRRAAWVFGFADRTPTVLLTYRTKDVDAQFTQPPEDSLRTAFSGVDHPVLRHALDEFERAPHHLFDSVHSVKMPRWHRGHVMLLGDSAWCLTLFSGMGSTAGLRGGSELAEALKSHPDDLETALNAWEGAMRPFITSSQRRAQIAQHLFVPTGYMSLTLRNTAMAVIARTSARKRRRSATHEPTAEANAGRRTVRAPGHTE